MNYFIVKLKRTEFQLFSVWLQKSINDFVLDSIGLFIQGIVVPWLAFFVAQKFEFKTFEAPAILLFLLPFTVVDYLFYWNHRLFHKKKIWPLHITHHTSEKLNWTVSSRNSLWSSFFMIYFWFQILIHLFVANSQYYAIAMTLHGVLDLWRHSGLNTPERLKKVLFFLILPEDHLWHHRNTELARNFGANINLWDRWHGTFQRAEISDCKLGLGFRSRFYEEFFAPWRIIKK